MRKNYFCNKKMSNGLCLIFACAIIFACNPNTQKQEVVPIENKEQSSSLEETNVQQPTLRNLVELPHNQNNEEEEEEEVFHFDEKDKTIKIIGKWRAPQSIIFLYRQDGKIYMYDKYPEYAKIQNTPNEFIIIKDKGRKLYFQKEDLEWELESSRLDINNPEHFKRIKMKCWQYLIDTNGYLVQKNLWDIYASYPPVK